MKAEMRIDVIDVIDESTMEVRVRGGDMTTWRLSLGCRIIRFACWVMGVKCWALEFGPTRDSQHA